MSQVIFTKLCLTASDMPKSSPFLYLKENKSDIIFEKSDFPGADIHPLYGIPSNSLPYSQQDYYTREVTPREVDAVLIENDCLRAVFLPHCGCRLWSLYHKKKNRELLHVNPVLRFANFAIRNAWTAGGVEWNIGWQGHTPMTCETLFCERVIDSETGTPVLRFYEFERRRRETYEVDAYLPDGSEFLLVRVRIKNNAQTEMPVYWWSNMAVPETPDTRLIVDTNEAFHCYSSTKHVEMADILHYDGTLDVTYPANLKKSADFFFRISPERRKFIAALAQDGCGLVQTSTSLLKGRKEFVWGTHSGGNRWQAFLSDGSKSYLEIQAGLAHTQMESVPLAAGSEFEWLEAYGLMEADPQKVHSADWETAKEDVRSRLNQSLDAEFLESELLRTRTSIVGVTGEPLTSGTGWGALENIRRKQDGLQPLDGFLSFDTSSLQQEQAPWLELLDTGHFPEPENTLLPPPGSQSQPEWIPLLENAIQNQSDHWFSHYQLGALFYANGQKEEARREFTVSLARKRTPWCLFALVQMDETNVACETSEVGETSEVCKLISECVQMLPENFWIIREAMTLYNQNGLYSATRKLYEENCSNIKDNGRLRALYLEAVVSMGDLDLAKELLKQPFEIADLREGGLIFHKIWIKYVTQLYQLNLAEPATLILQKYPIPGWMDFKMN